MRVLIFLLLSFSFGFASYTPEQICGGNTFLITCFPVVVFDDIKFTQSAFNAVAMIFNNERLWNSITLIIGICFTVSWVYKTMISSGKAIGSMSLLNGSIVYALFFLFIASFSSPSFKTTVTIADGRSVYKTYASNTQNMAAVGNIPYPLAFLSSLSSSISNAFVKIVETTITPTNGIRYSQIGLFQYLSLIDREKMISIRDLQEADVKTFVSRYDAYMQSCVLPFKARFQDGTNFLSVGKGSLKNISPSNLAELVDNGDDAWAFLSATSVSSSGTTCNVFWTQYLLPSVSPAMQIYRDYTLKKLNISDASEVELSNGLFTGVFAGSQSVLDNNMGDLSSFMQYQIRGQLDILNTENVYAKSLGLNAGITADSINYNVNKAFMRLHDSINQSHFIFSVENTPFILSMLNGIIVFAFPFIFFSCAILPNRAVKIGSAYIGSFLSLALIPGGLAFAHGMVAHYTLADGVNGILKVGTDYIHNYQYFQTMAEHAEMASNLAIAVMLGFPALITTGTIWGIASLGIGGMIMQGRTGGIEQYLRDKSQAEDAYNRNLEHAFASQAIQDGIRKNNEAAISMMGAGSNIDNYNRGYIASGLYQAGQTMGVGSQIINQNDLDKMMSGGRFGGVSQATAQKAFGEEMMKGQQDILDKNGNRIGSTSGLSKARTLGNYQADQAINTASGLQSSGAYGSDGLISNTAQGRNFQQGLENNARMSANSTQGIGEDGRFTNEEMRNIQRLAKAGAIANIQAGESLKENYGSNLHGGGSSGMSFDEVSKTSADMQNIEQYSSAKGFKDSLSQSGITKKQFGTVMSKGKTHSGISNIAQNEAMGDDLANRGASGIAEDTKTNTSKQFISQHSSAETSREFYNDISGGMGKNNFSETSKNLSMLQESQATGASSGINKLMNTASGGKDQVVQELQKQSQVGVTAPIQEARITGANLNINSVDAMQVVADAKMAQNAQQATEGIHQFNAKQKQGIFNSDGTLTQEANKQIKARGEYFGAKESGSILNFERDLDNARKNAIMNSEELTKMGLNKKQKELIANDNIEELAKELGFNDSDIKAIKNNKFEELSYFAKEKLSDMGGYRPMKARSNFSVGELFEKDNIEKHARQAFEKITQKTPNNIADFAKTTAINQFDGMYKGDVFSFTAGSGGVVGGMSSGISYSHNESRNYSYGMNVSGGSMTAQIARNLGMSPEAYGQISSTVQMVQGAVSLMGSFKQVGKYMNFANADGSGGSVQTTMQLNNQQQSYGGFLAPTQQQIQSPVTMSYNSRSQATSKVSLRRFARNKSTLSMQEEDNELNITNSLWKNNININKKQK